MEDKTITCRSCNQPFTFTVSEQQFYKEKGFEHEPVRCKNCRDARKSGKAPRDMHVVTCASCGQDTQVPFKPTGSKPVYCRDCFNKQRGGY
jgi:CxxC-x17-CxxC domain-containing protein